MNNSTNKNGLLLLLVALLAIGVGFWLGNSGDASDISSELPEAKLSKILNTKKLRIGYVVYPPIVKKDLSTGNLGGHFVETIEHIASEANLSIDYIEADWSSFKAGLDAERYDVSIAPSFSTIKRSTGVSFTTPLLYAGQSALARKEDARFLGVTDVMDLDQQNLKVAVLAGQAGHDFAKNHFTKAEIVVLTGVDVSLAYQSVIAGQADIALGDAPSVVLFTNRNPNTVNIFDGRPYDLTPVSWAVRHQDVQLLDFLNNAIDVLQTQGKIREFEKNADAKWLHKKVTYEYQ